MSAILAAFLALAVSWVLTRLVMAYARGAAMHDLPGARRMHDLPTVRGAGLGFVLVIVATWGGLGLALGAENPLGRWAMGSALALALVAGISWLDDRGGLPVWPRLLTHAIAAIVLIVGAWSGLKAQLPIALILVLPIFLVLPAINFWNFIDGINGIAATQALLVAAVIAMLAWQGGAYPASWFAAIVAGALCGFLPLNFPRAQAFMGDVGSASLGLIVVALALMPVAETGPMLPAALLMAAAVFLDTGLTLLWRMLRRPPRQWYTAHREHLYQWLTRAGWSHTRTTLSYLSFSLGVAALVLLIGPFRPVSMLIAVALLYSMGAVVWRRGRDYALRSARVRS